MKKFQMIAPLWHGWTTTRKKAVRTRIHLLYSVHTSTVPTVKVRNNIHEVLSIVLVVDELRHIMSRGMLIRPTLFARAMLMLFITR